MELAKITGCNYTLYSTAERTHVTGAMKLVCSSSAAQQGTASDPPITSLLKSGR